jgi:hypothetical protein
LVFLSVILITSVFIISSLLRFSDGSEHEEINHHLPFLSSCKFVSEILDFSGQKIEHQSN